MATYTANHLYLSVVLDCWNGPFAGEEAVWGWRFAVNGGATGGRPGLNDGFMLLNTFDVHTEIASRSHSIASKAGTVAQNWVGDAFPDSESVTANDIDFLLTKAGDFYAAVNVFIHQNWRMNSIRLYPTNKDGHAFAGPNYWTPTAAWSGGPASAATPEMAMCVSRYTTERSRRGRGRMYVGPLGQIVMNDTTGLFTTAHLATIGAAEKGLQDSVRTRGTPGASATYAGIVWNRKGDKRGSTGENGSVVNRIRVGDEPDRQERRTKSRPETFVNWDVA